MDTFAVWMCGFYEGEGTICNDISNNNAIRVCIYQNENCFIEAKKRWGGTIRERTRKSPASEKICVNYEWRLSKHEAEAFISDIKSYMRINYKITQMNNALNLSTQKINRKFKCKYCDKEYANPSGRRRHEKKSHLHSNASDSI